METFRPRSTCCRPLLSAAMSYPPLSHHHPCDTAHRLAPCCGATNECWGLLPSGRRLDRLKALPPDGVTIGKDCLPHATSPL